MYSFVFFNLVCVYNNTAKYYLRVLYFYINKIYYNQVQDTDVNQFSETIT